MFVLQETVIRILVVFHFYSCKVCLHSALNQHVLIYIQLFSYQDTPIIATVNNSLESNFVGLSAKQIQF